MAPERRRFLIAAGAGAVVFALVAVLVMTGVFDHLDYRVATYVADHRRQPFIAIASAFDRLAEPWLFVPIVAALLIGLWWSGRMVQALYLGVTVAVAVTLNPLLKLAFERPRPSDVTVGSITGYSFPSGHTTSATAIAVALAVVFWPTRWRWPMVVAAAVFAPAMAVSRVYHGVHWPSDVVGGLALGFSIAMAVRALMPWPSREEAAAAHGGGAAAAAGHDGGAETEVPTGEGRPGIDVVFLDWGNTLMVDNGMREGPMKDWDTVEAEAGAQQALQRLRARYRLVVATNAADSPAYFVRLALARVGLDDYIDDVVSSADVGDHKPNYAFFRAALLREGRRGVPLDPRRAVMVGDGTSNDIAGAQRAGMHTIWYNPTKRRFPDGAQPPDAVIKKLSDLPAAVDRLAGVRPEKRSRKRRSAEPDAVAAAASAAAARELRAAAAAEDSAASAAAAIPGAPAGNGAEPPATVGAEPPAVTPPASGTAPKGPGANPGDQAAATRAD